MSNAANARWVQLTLETLQHAPEPLEAALLEAGAIAITLRDAGDQPVLEPLPGQTPTWTHTVVTGLFDADIDIEVIKERLCLALDVDKLPLRRVESLAQRDWERAWLDDFRPMRFGKRLWVCPGNLPPPEPDAISLELDPGLAFGTGTHPTTALCLEWLEHTDLTDRFVIDYGCGSGILAISALKLGAARAWGIDIDPQALVASDRNAARNGVLERLDLCTPDAMPNTLQADILLANILAGPLIDRAQRLSGLVRPGGRLVLSGILADQAEAVQAAFSPWCIFDAHRQREDWVLLPSTRSAR
jgi:ribosomal protein L11 methyltransferase